MNLYKSDQIDPNYFEHLVEQGFAEPATKGDLIAIHQSLATRQTEILGQLARLNTRLHRLLRAQTIGLAVYLAVLVAMVVANIQLGRALHHLIGTTPL